MNTLSVRHESWPLARPFTISRGAKVTADVVVAEITDRDNITGWAECVPYPRYRESVDGVISSIRALENQITRGMTHRGLAQSMAAGAGRNALDCALWDLQAKQSEKRVWELTGTPLPEPATTAETLSIGEVEEMADAARALKDAPLLKVKLNRDKVLTRMAAIRDAAPSARLIIDPNESWDIDLLREVAKPLADLGVEVIEQPLPSTDDHALSDFDSPVDLCADESCHTADTLPELRSRYAMINIKLDKTGGLTAAMELAQAARKLDFAIMIGCMVGTSLAMAPATLLSPYARFVDLDGPLLLKTDRENGLTFHEGKIAPPKQALWG